LLEKFEKNANPAVQIQKRPRVARPVHVVFVLLLIVTFMIFCSNKLRTLNFIDEINNFLNPPEISLFVRHIVTEIFQFASHRAKNLGRFILLQGVWISRSVVRNFVFFNESGLWIPSTIWSRQKFVFKTFCTRQKKMFTFHLNLFRNSVWVKFQRDPA